MGKSIDAIFHEDEDRDGFFVVDLYESREGGRQFGAIRKGVDGKWVFVFYSMTGESSGEIDFSEFHSAISVIADRLDCGS